jgi:hypothetical protein
MFNRPDYSTVYFQGNLNGAANSDKILLIILPSDDFFGRVTKREGVLCIHVCKIKLKDANILGWPKVSSHPKRSLGLATISCLQCTIRYSDTSLSVL